MNPVPGGVRLHDPGSPRMPLAVLTLNIEMTMLDRNLPDVAK